MSLSRIRVYLWMQKWCLQVCFSSPLQCASPEDSKLMCTSEFDSFSFKNHWMQQHLGFVRWFHRCYERWKPCLFRFMEILMQRNKESQHLFYFPLCIVSTNVALNISLMNFKSYNYFSDCILLCCFKSTRSDMVLHCALFPKSQKNARLCLLRQNLDVFITATEAVLVSCVNYFISIYIYFISICV